MNRGYNFSAGPAMLPEEILKEAQYELLNWQNQDMSVMEASHRGDAVKALMHSAEEDLRDLLSIPQNYHVLFLSGAARAQFAMIPMNLLSSANTAGYLISGIWSSLAYQEAAKLSNAYVLACSQEGDNQFYNAAEPDVDQIKDISSYIYYTPNETINGIRFPGIPNVGRYTLVADMTSCLLTEPINISDYGLIFAGAQKNIAHAGMTLVIIRDDLLQYPSDKVLPTMLDYRVHAQHHSLYATPPAFNCYMSAKMFQWIKRQGGVAALYQRNCKKAERLYAYIDQSELFYCPVKKPYRSMVNVCFQLRENHLLDSFIAFAERNKLYGLRGHRLIGGLRASIYNAMPVEGVEKLIGSMQAFSKGRKR